MKRFDACCLALATLALATVAVVPASAQTSQRPRHATRARVTPARLGSAPAVDRVPQAATNGVPGSANSAKPDANVPPFQTPQDPVGGARR